MNDLSHDIKHARQLLSHIEILDNNAHINGYKPIYDAVQELQICIQLLLIKTADYALSLIHI